MSGILDSGVLFDFAVNETNLGREEYNLDPEYFELTGIQWEAFMRFMNDEFSAELLETTGRDFPYEPKTKLVVEVLEEAMEDGTIVKGYISSRVKGGLRVTVNGIMALLTGSLHDIRPVKDTAPFENKECELKIIKSDKERINGQYTRKTVHKEEQGK